MTFPFFDLAASRSQLASDNHSTMKVIFSGSNMVYTLPPIGSLGETDGWMQYIIIDPAGVPGNVLYITPSAGDLINGVWNALKPMPVSLSPQYNSGGLLSSDGKQWFFQGRINFAVRHTPIAQANQFPFPYGTLFPYTFIDPIYIEDIIECSVAEGGWVAGDSFSYSYSAVCKATAIGRTGMTIVREATPDANYSPTGGTNAQWIAFMNKTTMTIFVPSTAGNFNLIRLVRYRLY